MQRCHTASPELCYHSTYLFVKAVKVSLRKHAYAASQRSLRVRRQPREVDDELARERVLDQVANVAAANGAEGHDVRQATNGHLHAQLSESRQYASTRVLSHKTA